METNTINAGNVDARDNNQVNAITTAATQNLLEEKLATAFIITAAPLDLPKAKQRRYGNQRGGNKGVPTFWDSTVQALKRGTDQLSVGQSLVLGTSETKAEQAKLVQDTKTAVNRICAKTRRKFKVVASPGLDPTHGGYSVTIIRQDGRSNRKQRRTRKGKVQACAQTAPASRVEEIVPTKIVETEPTSSKPVNYDQILRRFSCLKAQTQTQTKPAQHMVRGSALDDIVI